MAPVGCNDDGILRNSNRYQAHPSERDSARLQLGKILTMPRRILIIAITVSAFAGASAMSSQAPAPLRIGPSATPRVLGPVAIVSEEESGLEFVARVDTGAAVCSLHAEEFRVDEGSEVASENVGKSIRFRIVNRRGESIWLERRIADVKEIKTSDTVEWRYAVPMMLSCEGTHKQVLVTLNDRSQMSYAMLLGRNLLKGEFVVDVDRAE
jgi:hypothetical protein